MKSIFFTQVKTLTELRNEYRRLAKIHHPDVGGVTATMQEINSEYDRLSKILIDENPEFSEGRKVYEHEVSEEIKVKLKPILLLDGITIEMIGSWIWVSGNTFTHREVLKETGYSFSHNKCAWYWHKGEYRKRSGNDTSLDQIRAFWGCSTIEKDEDKGSKSILMKTKV